MSLEKDKNILYCSNIFFLLQNLTSKSLLLEMVITLNNRNFHTHLWIDQHSHF